MLHLEQAVFTSAQTDHISGYQLVGRSGGLCEEDARELAVQCPSHDSLWSVAHTAGSINFHPLPSGAYCVSRSVVAGQEYSRRGPRVYTHCLIAQQETMTHFGNNPFLVLRAATAAAPLPVYDQVPSRLEPLELSGRAAVVDQMLLARLAVTMGPRWMGTLVQAALDSACLALTGLDSVEPLVAGLMSCLPPECRGEYSFATCLKPSLQRPFRILGLPGSAHSLREYQRRYNLTVLDLSAPPPEEISPLSGWGRLIEKVLDSGQIAFLATQLSKRRFELSGSDLPALGLQLLEDLDTSILGGEPAEKRLDITELPHGDGLHPRLQRAHASHSAAEAEKASRPPRPEGPSRHLAPESAEVLQQLESLDDAVFEAIGGTAGALEKLKVLWPNVRSELGETLLAESQEQYLRYALSIWEEYVASSNTRNPSKAVQALDVLCVLFDRL